MHEGVFEVFHHVIEADLVVVVCFLVLATHLTALRVLLLFVVLSKGFIKRVQFLQMVSRREHFGILFVDIILSYHVLSYEIEHEA